VAKELPGIEIQHSAWASGRVAYFDILWLPILPGVYYNFSAASHYKLRDKCWNRLSSFEFGFGNRLRVCWQLDIMHRGMN
jgi:hypothetical protein